jgi:hypothetical protein
MNNLSQNLTRRTFVKKSTVLATAVASGFALTGLVNAASYYQCSNYEFIEEHVATENGKFICWQRVKCNGTESFRQKKDCPASGTEEGERCRGLTLKSLPTTWDECDPLG